MSTQTTLPPFKSGVWNDTIDVRDFIQQNYTPYDGDDSFLVSPTESTKKLWDQVSVLLGEEQKKGILDADTSIISSIISHQAGYIDQSLEKIVGLQTDKPLKRSLMPYGGIRLAAGSLEAYGYKIDPSVEKIFSTYRKTHNEGVFEAYDAEMLAIRKSGIITGLPDAYGRGRIIGDYRRIALYGVDALITEKKSVSKNELSKDYANSESIREREEFAEQVKALVELKEMGTTYGFDIGRPAENAIEAVQWTYLGYLAAIKEQNGAAMSIGRVSTFFDIYFKRDIEAGLLTEDDAQEIVDHFVMKLRIVKFLRPPAYNELFSGDPTWVTEAIGGVSESGKHLVTKTSYRILHTLYNLGPAPEPNLTVLWSNSLPQHFKEFCAKVSIDTSSIQYESDDLMRPYWGDDYGIACCVSAMRIGKQMQFFGARANLAKALLYAINGGRDEVSGAQVGPKMDPVTSDVLNFDEVRDKLDVMLDWLAETYIKTLNVIHFMHDKYAYERLQMALHQREVLRTMATGIAGLSVAVDSLSAIKHATVSVVRDESGLATSFNIDGEYPAYGNNDDRVDSIAVKLVESFMSKLRLQETYRNSEPTLSVLTITSNVVYGKKTGDTPDGRKKGEPFAPGANPMNNRDTKGALASLMSVAKIPYKDAQDGISYTFSIIPKALGKDDTCKVTNLVGLLDGYFAQNGHHLNVNVFERELLLDAMKHPEKYPQLTVRVSGYAVNFVKLNEEQQLDVINRTFHNFC
ncbi:MAG: formate C-acetyltransferase [Fibrobacterales bacterium]